MIPNWVKVLWAIGMVTGILVTVYLVITMMIAQNAGCQ